MNKSRAKSIFGLILNLIVSIMLAILILMLPIAFYASATGVPATYFGYSPITIATSSMQNSGINAKDTILIKRINPLNLTIGDKVAFFAFANSTPENIGSYENYVASSSQSNSLSFDQLFGISQRDYQNASSQKCDVWFHQIVGIKIDSKGELWIQTWGTSNIDPLGNPEYDSNWTSQKYILGTFVSKLPVITWLYTNILFENPLVFAFIICLILLAYFMIKIMILIYKNYWINLLINKKISINDIHFTPKFFKDVELKDKAKILESANQNDLLIYKQKMFNEKYINY